MGGRELDVDEEAEARAAITLYVFDVGTDEEDIVFVESELDLKHLDIDLGEVTVFQPDDYWDGDEER
ncbi:hypothetical protein MUY35_03495 [Aliiroseovarius sp. S1339]|uniref:hypothetical protein n=1 Tax=Aliiroseovarius sp. S1339 TaxID=2936990 RepID=UPI0020BFCDA0|nr:hypothetical protein [Aliiroseovarius sp. S1339]MCK8462911.1 hypothetical protein [Aliiroseovarius sp. S1339]